MGRIKMRVLLADDNKDFCDVVTRYLQSQGDIDVVEVAHNGVEAYEKIKTVQPDVAILDGAMPELDGLGVLEKLNNGEYKPACIMLSGISTERVTKRAYELGAEYYIIKPFDLDVLAERIRLFKGANTARAIDTASGSSAKSSPIDLEGRITQILHEVGVPPNIRGFSYARDAIIMAVKEPESMHYITKELYPMIAKSYNATPGRVERAIRHAIEVAWMHGGVDVEGSLSNYTVKNHNCRPTNSEFIAFVADKLRLEMYRQ